MNCLTLRGVTKRFGGLVAVRDVDMDIAHGERRALIGPNGAGKSTLFNVIAGDLPTSAGQIIIFDKDVTHMPVHKRVALGLRRTYQTSALFDKLTVRENLYLGVIGPGKGHFNALKRATGDTERMCRVNETADSVRITEKLDSLAGDLSHGERRQLEIGLAIAYQPKFVMLDEPAAGLSPDERKVLKKLLNGLPRDITLLLIEHDMDVALSVGERVTVLHEGAVVAEGTPTEITSNPMVQRIYLGGALDE
jgi:branched-chain amino acid transport system ATP-binding protein